MLKARVITALVLLPVALLILFVLPEDAFAMSVGLIVLVGAWEFPKTPKPLQSEKSFLCLYCCNDNWLAFELLTNLNLFNC